MRAPKRALFLHAQRWALTFNHTNRNTILHWPEIPFQCALFVGNKLDVNCTILDRFHCLHQGNVMAPLCPATQACHLLSGKHKYESHYEYVLQLKYIIKLNQEIPQHIMHKHVIHDSKVSLFFAYLMQLKIIYLYLVTLDARIESV